MRQTQINGQSDSASQSEQTARTHSMETTRKASARSKKEHKMSFKVATAAGTEDQQVRKIKNPFPDCAARVRGTISFLESGEWIFIDMDSVSLMI